MILAPKCDCASLTRAAIHSVFTCPECCKAALRVLAGEALDQHELFAYVDSRVSVSGLVEGEVFHIEDELQQPVEDGLPF